MPYYQQLLILCPLSFFASFVDAVAGGGGLLSIPAYMLTGVPIHIVYGSNKLSACCGTLFAAGRFLKNGRVCLRAAITAAVFALAGAVAGSRINLLIDAVVLKKMILVLFPVVAVVVLFGGRAKRAPQQAQGARLYGLCALCGLVIGAYDGLVGPGTGTFLILGFTGLMGFDYVTASGNAKIVNLASNVASLAVFAAAGKINYALALPAAAAAVAGGLAGSGMAVKRGAGFIRGMLVIVLLCVFARLCWDVFAG